MDKIIFTCGDTHIYECISDGRLYSNCLKADTIDDMSGVCTISQIIITENLNIYDIMPLGCVYDVVYENELNLIVKSNKSKRGFILDKKHYRYEEVFNDENLDFIDEL